MCVEIILDEDDRLGFGEVDIGQVFENLGIVDGRTPVGDLDMAPAFERREHHEQVDDPIAGVLAIHASGLTRLHCDLKAGFGDELLGGLIQTNQRSVGIAGPGVDRHTPSIAARKCRWPWAE